MMDRFGDCELWPGQDVSDTPLTGARRARRHEERGVRGNTAVRRLLHAGGARTRAGARAA